jgi:hypothetical protein
MDEFETQHLKEFDVLKINSRSQIHKAVNIFNGHTLHGYCYSLEDGTTREHPNYAAP